MKKVVIILTAALFLAAQGGFAATAKAPVKTEKASKLPAAKLNLATTSSAASHVAKLARPAGEVAVPRPAALRVVAVAVPRPAPVHSPVTVAAPKAKAVAVAAPKAKAVSVVPKTKAAATPQKAKAKVSPLATFSAPPGAALKTALKNMR